MWLTEERRWASTNLILLDDDGVLILVDDDDGLILLDNDGVLILLDDVYFFVNQVLP